MLNITGEGGRRKLEKGRRDKWLSRYIDRIEVGEVAIRLLRRHANFTVACAIYLLFMQ